MQGVNWYRFLLLLALAWLAYPLQAQDVTASLTSREKLVMVGMPFEVELTVRHPERTVVIFPDTSKDFLPYEVESGKAMPTKTDDGISEDTKIYRLYTWEIDSLQNLQFPVGYIDAKGDTAKVVSNLVQVEFQPVIPAYSDTLKTRMISNLAEIREPINWAAWGLIIAGILLVLVVAIVVLFRPVRKMFRRARIEREWRRYLGQLQALSGKMQDQNLFYPALNKVWRGYFDRDWFLALGSMTTTELQAVLPSLKSLDAHDQASLESLSKTTDMVIYAGRQQPEQDARNYFEEIRRIMIKEYMRRKEVVEL